jgi:hypothetical protein
MLQEVEEGHMLSGLVQTILDITEDQKNRVKRMDLINGWRD